jgi:hypothetical protein
MLDDVIDHVLHEIDARIKHISEYYKDATEEHKRKMYGDIGETFVGRSIKYGLMDIGFVNRHSEETCSFRITPQYGADSKRMHGIDFKVDIKDAHKRTRTFLVESKNWGMYKIGPSQFSEEILPRFTDCDPEHKWNWMVTLNRTHIGILKELCSQNHIDIISLEGKLTPESNINEIIKPAIRCFVSNFIKLIENHINCAECKKPDPKEMGFKYHIDEIREFIRRGVPDRVICLKFKIPLPYLSKIKSEMRAKGARILDGRTKEADDDKLL